MPPPLKRPTADKHIASKIAKPAEETHALAAAALRALAADAVERARSGHPGMPLGMADIATILFREFIKFAPASPEWPDRDRFVLSAGHGSMVLYGILHLIGVKTMTLESLKQFRQLGSLAAGHPELTPQAGIETTTGPLGQGFANAVGMALAERMMQARFGTELVDHRVWVIAGDGCLMEGISHEAASLAGHLCLNRLVVLFDDNGISIDGPTSLASSEDSLARFASYGWRTERIDGHNPDSIRRALKSAMHSSLPSLIACRTRIGFGAGSKEGSAASHGAPLGQECLEAARIRWNWPHAPFEIPKTAYEAWEKTHERTHPLWLDWQKKLHASPQKNAFETALLGGVPAQSSADIETRFAALKERFLRDSPRLASRAASQCVLEKIVPRLPMLIGGSADLTGSNNTRIASMRRVSREDFSGNYIHFGVREHAMAAMATGMALHKGFLPYIGTFLAFSDYCRPAIRLAAMMGQRVIFVMTHDSIGLGEDGPTHQPIEQLTALRAIPNLWVLRPADALETADAWQIALARTEGPVVLALSRQSLPTLAERQDSHANLCREGARRLDACGENRHITLIASGSEVPLALEAAQILAAEGVKTAVVSLCCMELFRLHKAREEFLGKPPRVFIEAGLQMCWNEFMRPQDAFIGLKGFGASAPAEHLFAHFGLVSARIAEKARTMLST